jgi:hypothetical protein
MLSGVLERSPRDRPEPVVEPETPTEAAAKSRGAASTSKPPRAPASRSTKRIKGRTIYIADDLWERIIVQSHRRDLNISDYCCLLLDRHVPDHRVVRSGPSAAQQQDQVDDQDAV